MIEERLMKDTDKIELTNGGSTLLHRHPIPINLLRKTSDQSNNLNILNNVTDLVFNIEPNIDYAFEFSLIFQTQKTTTGIRIDFSGPVGLLGDTGEESYGTPFIAWRRETGLASQTAGTGNVQTRDRVAYQSDTPSASVGVANSNHLILIKGVLCNGANYGSLQLQFASEVSGSAVTIKKGSWGIWF